MWAVIPEVAVIKPEIVGVAVQEVPVTVRFPPKVVRLLPVTVKVPATSNFERGSVVPMPTFPLIKAFLPSHKSLHLREEDPKS